VLEKVTQFAEQAATNVSRRQFLGRFGRAATGAAAVLGGFLAFPGLAVGGRKPPELCSPQSDFYCVDRPVGYPCAGRGSRCRVRKGTDNVCYCSRHGRPPRGGGR
jgi:hypothetical protein